MQRLRNYILFLMTCGLFASCAEDSDLPEPDVHFCVRAEWTEGRSMPQTRASEGITNTILAAGTSGIDIPVTEYPETITVKDNDNTTQFSLAKGTQCSSHEGFIIYNGNAGEVGDISGLTLTATATLDGEELSGTATTNGNHIQFTLHHTKALLRFAFKVDGNYDKIRQVKVTGISLNGSTCTIVDNVLSSANQIIAYSYIDPTVVTTSYENTIRCTYNIYDKDGVTDEHITRKDVIAENKFKLNSLKDNSSPVTVIRAGYYYDLNITLNPDYLYVLSDHDNKHMTIE